MFSKLKNLFKKKDPGYRFDVLCVFAGFIYAEPKDDDDITQLVIYLRTSGVFSESAIQKGIALYENTVTLLSEEDLKVIKAAAKSHDEARLNLQKIENENEKFRQLVIASKQLEDTINPLLKQIKMEQE
jgi:hypothetical protein